MRRLPLALASLLMASMATVAGAQNPYGYAPNAMRPGGTPPGIFPGAAQHHAAIPAPPTPKLPRGVSDDGGLLFYNGKPYQDGSNPYGRQMSYAQQASYQQGPEGMPGGMSPAQQYAATTQGMGYGEGYADGGQCNGYCDDPYCTNCGHPGLFHRFCGWFGGNGRGFPGKMGSVWSAGAELLYYTREHSPDRSLVLNTNDNSITEIAAQDLDYIYEPGFRTWISYMGPSGIAAQFVYLQCNNMEASQTVRGDNNLQLPFPFAAATVGYFGADQMTLDAETNFQSFEANIIYPWSSIQFLLGYRYVQVLERSSITATDLDVGGEDVFGIPVCDNRLNGAQIGVLGQYEAFGLVNFDFTAKWGIYGNAMRQHQIVTDNGGSVIFRDSTGTDTDVSYVTELTARAVFPMGPIFSIQAGYDVFFINRLALATQQYDFDVDAAAGTFVSGGRNLIIHGVSGGLTAKW